MKAQQSLQEWELDHVLRVPAAEEAWEGQLDLSCPKSHVAQQGGRMALLAWGHWGSIGVLPKYDSLPGMDAMKTSDCDPYFIYPILQPKNSFKSNMIT